jgi:hypothetical protein
MEIGNAGLHFLRRRFAIAHRLARRVRAAFQNVGDINRVASKAHRLNDAREQLAGLAHERFALDIFIGARRFAHEHQRRGRIADAEHDIFA